MTKYFVAAALSLLCLGTLGLGQVAQDYVVDQVSVMGQIDSRGESTDFEAPRATLSGTSFWKWSRVLVSFDLTALPELSRIDSAYLQLEMVEANNPDKVPMEVFASKVAWNQKANWQTTDGSASWPKDANGYANIDYAAAVDDKAAPQVVVSQAGTIRVDITQLVRLWTSGKMKNEGLILRMGPTIFGLPQSKNWSVGMATHHDKEAKHRPRLLIGGVAGKASAVPQTSQTPATAPAKIHMSARPKLPYHGWFIPAHLGSRPELYPHLNLVTSFTEDAPSVALAQQLNGRGIATLRWAYGPNSTYANNDPLYFVAQVKPQGNAAVWSGVAVDEYNTSIPLVAKQEEAANTGLRMARLQWPDLFIAVWVTGPNDAFVRLMQDRVGDRPVVDLAMIEGYTYVPDHGEWGIGFSGIVERVEKLKKAGVLDRVVVCWGHVSATPDTHGSYLKIKDVRKMAGEMKQRYPEMPGIIFYGGDGKDDSPPTLELIGQCDALSEELYPAPAAPAQK